MLLSRLLPRAASMHPERPAIQSVHGMLTYEQLLHRVNCIAAGFASLGVRPGYRIALLGDPSAELVAAELAAAAVGAIPFAIFPGLTSHEQNGIVQDAAPAVVVYDAGHANAAAFAAKLQGMLLVACRDTDRAAPLSLERFVEDCPPLSTWHDGDPDDIALLIYTGGTTGRSKDVMHTHRSIRSWSFLNPDHGGGHRPDKKTLLANMAHLTGQMMLWLTLFEGGCLIIADAYPLRFAQVMAIVEREQLVSLGTVGLMFKDIAETSLRERRPLPSLRAITCGGAPIREQTLHKAQEAFPHATMIEVYAQTESGQFISFLNLTQTLNEGKLHRLHSVGHPAHVAYWGQKPFEVRIVDEDGRELAAGETGEIVCRGEAMMRGYWNNPAETERTIRNGWLHTGDMGRFDEDGYLYVVDRKKDMIIVGASNVYSSEVEAVAGRHPSVAEIAVVGMPREEEGEEIAAIVELRDRTELTLDQLRTFCRQWLAEYKLPTRLHIATSGLPRTAVGKPDKAALRKTLRSEPAR
ncbi:MAG: acyl--CoA ligase [Paenibacillaceae bacterium]|nr:acyl--CoA ligase [Paenibacillaceae bacterium]